MKQGGKHSLETRLKISAAHKGKVPRNIATIAGWNKGTKGLSSANAGSFKKGEHRAPATEFKKGTSPWNKGLRGYRTGSQNNLWKGGITPMNQAIRTSMEYKEWRRHVFQRDDYTCQACGTRGGKLHADHELPFSLFPDLRLEILNGRTLCVDCHKQTPTYAGKVFSFDL